jgi:hypothetical protein
MTSTEFTIKIQTKFEPANKKCDNNVQEFSQSSKLHFGIGL